MKPHPFEAGRRNPLLCSNCGRELLEGRHRRETVDEVLRRASEHLEVARRRFERARVAFSADLLRLRSELREVAVLADEERFRKTHTRRGRKP